LRSKTSARGVTPCPDDVAVRREILVVAEELSATIGYRKTTVGDIESRLGMSRANVYWFFAGRASINEALVGLQLNRIGDELERIDNSEEPPPQRLALVLRTLAERSLDLFVAGGHVSDIVKDAPIEAWPVSVRYIRRIQNLLFRVVDCGSASGDFQVDDALLAADCIETTMTSFMHPTLASSYRNDKPDIDDVTDFVLRGLGPNLR
jgi:AcrR family transcriptional regulator